VINPPPEFFDFRFADGSHRWLVIQNQLTSDKSRNPGLDETMSQFKDGSAIERRVGRHDRTQYTWILRHAARTYCVATTLESTWNLR
jgi:hypothetical protein